MPVSALHCWAALPELPSGVRRAQGSRKRLDRDHRDGATQVFDRVDNLEHRQHRGRTRRRCACITSPATPTIRWCSWACSSPTTRPRCSRSLGRRDAVDREPGDVFGKVVGRKPRRYPAHSQAASPSPRPAAIQARFSSMVHSRLVRSSNGRREWEESRLPCPRVALITWIASATPSTCAERNSFCLPYTEVQHTGGHRRDTTDGGM